MQIFYFHFPEIHLHLLAHRWVGNRFILPLLYRFRDAMPDSEFSDVTSDGARSDFKIGMALFQPVQDL
ncbi:hypothetical protein, partial [Paenibacillus naphthalenovorans]|uniref:hypothetical protein n=1 Tax=Paenibacillus naphthalenovorans TaxID=162209 RepID=UPI003D2A07A6